MSGPADFASAVQELMNTLLESITDPADAIRIFSQLNSFATTPIVAPTSQVGSAQTVVQNGTADLVRRAAAVALAQASSLYQPTSQNDAEGVQTIVCDILDNEILIAGDQGQDETFLALSNLRTAVAQDLTARGAALPTLQTFVNNAPMPALVLAYQYYQDITRADQIIAFANPRHPAFMPTSFAALSS